MAVAEVDKLSLHKNGVQHQGIQRHGDAALHAGLLACMAGQQGPWVYFGRSKRCDDFFTLEVRSYYDIHCTDLGHLVTSASQHQGLSVNSLTSLQANKLLLQCYGMRKAHQSCWTHPPKLGWTCPTTMMSPSLNRVHLNCCTQHCTVI